MYKILGDRVLIRLLPLEKVRKYAIMKLELPENVEKDVYRQPTGVVEQIGEGKFNGFTGNTVPQPFKVGDVVIVNVPPNAIVIEIGDKEDKSEHMIISAQEVIAIITDEAEKARQLARQPESLINVSS